MAESQNDDQNREDLSDEASPYRLEEFRKQGRVSQSRELSGVIALLACGLTFYALSPSMLAQVTDLMKDVFQTDLSSRMDLGSTAILNGVFFKALKVLFWVAFPVTMMGFVSGIFGSYVQVGSVFSTEPLAADMSRLDPVKGLQRLISMKALYDAIRMIVRMVVVVAVGYTLVKTQILKAPSLGLQDPMILMKSLGSSGMVIFVSLCAVLVVFAGIDFWLQKWEFGKSVRLTKQEAKQEQKEHEGDPLLKARVRTIQRDMARKRMMNAVKKADVIITNPTHIAIAIIYSKDKMDAPKVIAKGADFMAQKIKKIAAEANVPMVENVPLARTLYKSVKVGQYVPRALYQAVAEVLAYVYRLKNRKV